MARPTSPARRAAAVLAGSAWAAAGLVVSPAVAGPSDPHVIDPAVPASLTVHRLVDSGGPTGPPSDGTPVDTSGLTALANGTVDLDLITGADLTTSAGWVAAEALSRSFDPADLTGFPGSPYGLTRVDSQSYGPGDDGAVQFTGLDVGVYLVTESDWTSGSQPMVPFVVTLPLSDGDGGWRYDVHTYPKSTANQITVTVDDLAAVSLGDTDEVVWTVEADIADLASAADYEGFRLAGGMSTGLTVTDVTVALADGTPVPTGTCTVDWSTPGELLVDFVGTGPTSGWDLLYANAGSRLVLTVTTTVTDVGEHALYVVEHPNQDWAAADHDDPNASFTSAPRLTRWGGLSATVKDADGLPVEGAGFQVYWSDDSADPAAVGPVTIGTEDTFYTDASGVLDVQGLRYGRWAGGSDVVEGDPGWRQYYLVQVSSSGGNQGTGDPTPFEPGDTDPGDGGDIEIVNVPDNAGFGLPVTGGAGLRMVYLVGAAIVASAALLVRRVRRRQRQVG